jgi:hypothetical protein
VDGGGGMEWGMHRVGVHFLLCHKSGDPVRKHPIGDACCSRRSVKHYPSHDQRLTVLQSIANAYKFQCVLSGAKIVDCRGLVLELLPNTHRCGMPLTRLYDCSLRIVQFPGDFATT